MSHTELVQDLCTFLDESPSPWHGADSARRRLEAAGYTRLQETEHWHFAAGKYYVMRGGSAIVAFRIPASPVHGWKIALAHSDSPSWRVKGLDGQPAAGYTRLPVEGYGGMIRYSWLDRPLGLAGAVMLRGDSPMRPVRRLVSWDEGVLVIPNVAIHMNREVNKGVAVRPNVDMLPICRAAEAGWEKDGYLLGLLAKKLKVEKEDILSFELCAYCRQKAEIAGFEGDLLVSPRLDNLSSVHAVLRGLLDAGKAAKGINVSVLYDNEEIGSNTRRGADSATLNVILEKLALALGHDRAWLLDAQGRGMLLSCDAAHAVHPNHPEYADFSCAPVLGRGVALKRSPRYSSVAETCAVIEGLCRENGIPMQTYMNRAGLPGGGTVGSMASALLAMPAADVGVPILAMHSACETMGAADQDAFVRLVTAFFAAQ